MDLPPLPPAGEAIGLNNQYTLHLIGQDYVTISLPSSSKYQDILQFHWTQK
jgi:hypothetical protein